MDFFAENAEDKKLWEAYARMLGYMDPIKMLEAYFKGNLISEWDDIFNSDIAPLLFEKIVDSLNITQFSTDFTSGSKYKGGERLIRLNVTGTTSLKRNQIQQLGVYSNDATLQTIKNFITLIVEDVTLPYSTAHYNGILFSGNVNNDLLNGVLLDVPENSDEQRNPRKEDKFIVNELITHLNSNLEYYN